MTEEQRARYEAAMHRMQSAVAFDITKQLNMPGRYEVLNKLFKDLRVGLNSTLRNNGVLADMLIKKGVFTEEEYFEAMVAGAEQEASERAADVRTKWMLGPGVEFR
jgi:hypothetical protein